MQRSNTYVIIFVVILTVVLGGLLSGVNQGLKEAQNRSIDLDTKKKILGAVMDISTIETDSAILATYEARVTSIVVNREGKQLTDDGKGGKLVAEKVNIQKQYRFDPKDRQYPVFMFMNDQNTEQVDAYIFPMWASTCSV